MIAVVFSTCRVVGGLSGGTLRPVGRSGFACRYGAGASHQHHRIGESSRCRGQPVGICSLLHSDGGTRTADPMTVESVSLLHEDEVLVIPK
jgi:hypothetical protein